MLQLPITPTFEGPDSFARAGFEFGSLVDTDMNYSQFEYSPEALFSEPSYDSVACRPPPSTGIPTSYLTPNSENVNCSRKHSISGSSEHSPHFIDSPATEFSYAGLEPEGEPTQPLPTDGSFPAGAAIKRSIAESCGPRKRNSYQARALPGSFDQIREGEPLGQQGLSAKSRSKSMSSKPKSTAAKSKGSSSSASSRTSTSQNSAHKNQLRTASRKPKPPGPAPPEEQEDDDLTNEERRARQSHNLVEKQYRNRLNQQFESLLAVLPAERSRKSISEGKNREKGPGAAASAVDEDDRRLSKAEVLDMARQRILALEQDCMKLQNERSELLNNISQVRHVVAANRLAEVPPVLG